MNEDQIRDLMIDALVVTMAAAEMSGSADALHYAHIAQSFHSRNEMSGAAANIAKARRLIVVANAEMKGAAR